MSDRIDFSDTDLSAWLDGAGDAEQRARVESYLRGDAAAAAKVRLWQADRDALRARFEAVSGEPVPQRLADTVHAGVRGSGGWSDRGWARAASVAGLLVAGGLIGSALTWQL